MKGIPTLRELSSLYKVLPTVNGRWKRQLIACAAAAFPAGKGRAGKTEEELTAPRYEQIGRRKMELDWLQQTKVSIVSASEKRQ